MKARKFRHRRVQATPHSRTQIKFHRKWDVLIGKVKEKIYADPESAWVSYENAYETPGGGRIWGFGSLVR